MKASEFYSSSVESDTNHYNLWPLTSSSNISTKYLKPYRIAAQGGTIG